MALNQMNEEFNDPFETYFPRMRGVKRALLRLSTSAILGAIRGQRNLLGGQRRVNERILEYPYIFSRIRPGVSVLDIGCTSSRLPIQLASLGYDMHGVDLIDYPFSHPNFLFYKKDIFEWEPGRTFDSIILLSTIEHFGLGIYGDDPRSGDMDKVAVRRIGSWLKKGGQMLVTTPFGRPRITAKHRIYDAARLARVFPASVFRRVDERYFLRQGLHWAPSNADALKDVDSPHNPPNGVVLLDLEKI